MEESCCHEHDAGCEEVGAREDDRDETDGQYEGACCSNEARGVFLKLRCGFCGEEDGLAAFF